MEPTDEMLVLARRRGDISAREALVLRYQRLIFSIPRRFGIGEEQSAEVFSTCLQRLLNRLIAFSSLTRSRPYCIVIVQSWGSQHD